MLRDCITDASRTVPAAMIPLVVIFTVLLSADCFYCRGVVPRGLGPPGLLKKRRRVADALSTQVTAKRPSRKARQDARLLARRGGFLEENIWPCLSGSPSPRTAKTHAKSGRLLALEKNCSLRITRAGGSKLLIWKNGRLLFWHGTHLDLVGLPETTGVAPQCCEWFSLSLRERDGVRGKAAAKRIVTATT